MVAAIEDVSGKGPMPYILFLKLRDLAFVLKPMLLLRAVAFSCRERLAFTNVLQGQATDKSSWTASTDGQACTLKGGLQDLALAFKSQWLASRVFGAGISRTCGFAMHGCTGLSKQMQRRRRTASNIRCASCVCIQPIFLRATDA